MSKKSLVFLLIPFLLFSAAFSASADKKEERLWEDEIVYSLMVDRFNNGDNSNDEGVDLSDPANKFQGGDFRGIIQKLDYLKDMGFTTIMLSPVFKNEENGFHGEWVNDFYETDPHFGTVDELRELVNEAHNKDMKIMFEFVTTHVGQNHPWTKDPSKKDWFKTEAMDSDNKWLNGLPQLDLNNREVQRYLIDAAKWWIGETGVDGFSLSGIDQAPIEFWEDFSAAVKEQNDHFYLTGTASEGTEDLKKYQEAGIAGVVDSALTKPLRDSYSIIDVSSKSLMDVWEKNSAVYPDPQSLGALFDDRNSTRYTKDMVDKKQYPGARWKLALFYLYTQPEVPVVFYGTEIAVNGDLPPDNVPVMNFRADEELMEFIGRVGIIRQEQKALSRGDMELLYEKDGMLVFKREYEGETVVVAINNTTKDQTVVIPSEKIENDKELRGLFASDLVKSENGNYKIVVDREMMEVYKLADKAGYNVPFIFSIFAVFIVFGLFMYFAWKRGKKRNPYE
ncbi:alpha-amylase family glycosyl hydrolase [Siminovitchia fortis]|uniref:Alpha-amlyase n=1 Tax=Siminovitchia fortis TaxID=254758 RepID=A0A443J286_9BACI|nr:alpha-amylase family glycosyl hydrolase [Siminovitchia fortis]RWR14549.1 alpha-amlyase [Siminovitchia fortis]WHY83589.1 alpha-amylase family glycosyl hydrolase [Siminovitchia fortis]